MASDLGSTAALLLYLAGTFLYGFLVRELLCGPRRDRRNLPFEALVVCLFIWYAGCLADELAATLLHSAPAWPRLATLLDLGRAAAWLAAFPLLAHGIWRFLPAAAPRPRGLVLLPGYVTLLLFVPAMGEAWAARAGQLTALAAHTYAAFLLHSTLSLLVAAELVRRALRHSLEPATRRFLLWLIAAMALTQVLNLLAFRLLGSSSLWSLLALASGLVLGLTFVYFVLNHNVLRLTFRYRSLRHFVLLVLPVALAAAAGPAVTSEGRELYRQVVAWAIAITLLGGLLGTRLVDALARRSRFLRRLLGRSVPPHELERLTARLRALELDEGEEKALVAAEVERWLGARARFLDPEPGSPLHEHFAASAARGVSRETASSAALLRTLEDEGLQAALPLRARGRLVAVLALETPAAAGPQELQAVELVLLELGAAIEARRVVEEKVAAERRLGEEERLRMLGLVAASLAHELKNPLSAMKTLTQALLEDERRDDPGGRRRRDLEAVSGQIERLNLVAREVLGFARPRPGAALDLAALVRSAVYVLAAEARSRAIEIDGTAVEAVALVPGSEGAWQTIVFNLILNAVQRAPDSSRVRVRLRRVGDAVEFATANAGPPVPAPVLARLFEPFASEGGTGLGLKLVADRVHGMAGRIAVASGAEGVEVTVSVPGS